MDAYFNDSKPVAPNTYNKFGKSLRTSLCGCSWRGRWLGVGKYLTHDN